MAQKSGELLWNDGEYRKIYFLGPRGVSCGSLVREPGSTIETVCAHCLGREGRHFFCGIIKDWFPIEAALRQIGNCNSIALPPQWSTQAIPLEALKIFQEHAPEIGVLPGDTTSVVVKKTSKVRGNPYPFFKLTHAVDVEISERRATPDSEFRGDRFK